MANPENVAKMKATMHAKRTPERVAFLEMRAIGAAAKKVTTCCECCGKELVEDRKKHIDHDHDTGKFRGILCLMCNSGIGMLGDNIEGLERAIAYLQSKDFGARTA